MYTMQWGNKDSSSFTDAFFLRELVFINEQGFVDEADDLDATADHLVLYDDEKPIATARLVDLGGGRKKIGRVCVRKELRGTGLGRVIMEEAERFAGEQGAVSLTLGSQCHAQRFYAALGYRPEGEVFMEEHCPHIQMTKIL